MMAKQKHEVKSFDDALAQEIGRVVLQALEERVGTPQPRSQLMALFLELLMKAERRLHLEGNDKDKANGYYKRTVGTTAGPIEVMVPRDRDGDFRPEVLPEPYKREMDEVEQLLYSLFVNTNNAEETKRVLRCLDLSYPSQQLEKIRKDLLEEQQKWQERQLSRDYFALFIDAYHCDVKEGNKVRKAVIYFALGINVLCKREALGMYLFLGSESKDHWKVVLSDITSRGVERVLMVVSDNFPGLSEAIEVYFPKALHQLCLVHLKRNIRNHMTREDARELLEKLDAALLLQDYDEAMQVMSEALEKYRSKYKRFVSRVIEDLPRYLAVMKLPMPVRKYFKTTNAVEAVNRTLERLRQTHQGFWNSKEALLVSAYCRIREMQTRWDTPIPHLVANKHLLLRAFENIYDDLPSHTTSQQQEVSQ